MFLVGVIFEQSCFPNNKNSLRSLAFRFSLKHMFNKYPLHNTLASFLVQITDQIKLVARFNMCTFLCHLLSVQPQFTRVEIVLNFTKFLQLIFCRIYFLNNTNLLRKFTSVKGSIQRK